MAKEAAGIRFRSDVLRHVNKQTFGADSSTEIAESIETPGYAREVDASAEWRTAMLLVAANVRPDPGNNFGAAATEGFIETQIQYGDQSASPALVDPDSIYYLADMCMHDKLIGGAGLSRIIWPLSLVIQQPQPIIATQKFTIVHDISVNHAGYQSKDIFTSIYYRIVDVASTVYTQILLGQTRTS